MVWGTELTREQRREVNRQKQIERALAAGDLELAEMYRLAEYDDESTPEEDAEDARISKERAANGKWIEYDFDNFDAEWEAMYPEDARLFKALDEAFPDWEAHIERLPEEYPEEVEYLRQLDERLPAAAKMFREHHDDLRLP